MSVIESNPKLECMGNDINVSVVECEQLSFNTSFPLYNYLSVQANGLDERYNQTLQNMLVKYTHQKKAVWDDFLDTCVYAYNTSVHETTAFTPFELMFGRRAVLPIDLEIAKCDPQDILEQQQLYNPEANVSTTLLNE